jgi:outer membrane receptor protein involved in Fe transport
VISLSAPAFAQEATETVVVTGSRIPQTGLYSSSPVSVIGHQDFQVTGSTNTEELLRDLPSTVLDGDNSMVNNGTGGISSVDLRGMGTNRTLVLIDGKRVQPADQSGDIDLAQIPAAMIDHIEVLTGGASSVYGGDAVSGVVNIVLRKDFEGVEASGQYSVTKYDDGPTDDASVLFGVNTGDGKGNVTAYAEYYNQASVPSSARPWAKQVLADPNGDVVPGCAPVVFHGFCYFGSSRIPQGWFTDIGQIFTTSGTLVPYAGESYDFMPSEFAQSQHTRYAFGANGHYEVNKSLDFYTRMMFSDNDNHTQLAPIAYSDPVEINCGNPYVTAQERTVLFPGTASAADCTTVAPYSTTGGINSTVSHTYRARFVAAGPRNTDNRNDEFQILVGAKGDLGNNWSYDASASFGQSQELTIETGDLNQANFQATLLSDTLGTCSNGDPTCYPSNIFTTQSGISPLAATYFKAADQSVAISNEWDMQANLVGDFGHWGGQSPWAKTPIGFALGTEYRQEASKFVSAGPISVFNGSGGYEYAPPDAGSYNVSEGYTEVKIPVVEGQPFFESVEADGGYRYSAYSLAGATTSWKGALSWQPIDDIKFRASQERAVREPHIFDLFGGQDAGAFNGYDPCGLSGVGQLQASLALCEATGVTAAEYKGAGLDCGGQCNAIATSNPNLKAETGITRSLGVVLTPTFLDGFTATVDYYNINISGAINTLPFQTVMTNCYSPIANPTQSASNPFCELIHRDQFGSFNSSVGYAYLPKYNIGSQGAKGFDFESHYRTDLDALSPGIGSIGLDFKGTWAQDEFFTLAGSTDQCAGHYDTTFCDVPAPKWRHNLRVTWYSPSSDLSIYGTWRYFTGTTYPSIASTDPLQASLPGESYFDLGATWQISQGVSLYGGATNVLDTKPPLIDTQEFSAAFDNVNTFPSVYDVMGTTFFIGGTVKF